MIEKPIIDINERNSKIKDNDSSIYGISTDLLMMVKCTSLKHKDEFLNGKIYFGSPEAWIAEAEKGNIGQGDFAEGTICCLIYPNNAISHYNKEKLLVTNDGERYYFRRIESKNIRACCFYGLTFGDFQKEIHEDGKAERISIIPKDYFSAFYGEKAEENSAILITQPQIIIDKLLQRLIEMGANIGTDVFVSSVKYKKIPRNVMYDIQYPFEFFRKDIAFAKQKEIRILVDINKNEILKENLSVQNFTIDIGDISKYATAYEAYENDMITSLKGSKLLFSLPKTRVYDMSEMNAPELIEEMFAAYFRSIRSNEKPEKRIELIEGFSHLIEQKCQMSFSINNDRITCYGEPVGYEEWWHEFTDRGKLERKIKDTVESFICTQKYTEAIEYCKQFQPNERLKELLNYMYLKINCGAKAFDVAEQILPVCIDEEIYAIQALEKIVQTYCSNDMYEEALQKAILLEETYGYNHRIHNYKGVCYVKSGHFNEAIEEFNNAIKLSNNSPADWNLKQLNRVLSGDLAPENVQSWII